MSDSYVGGFHSQEAFTQTLMGPDLDDPRNQLTKLADYMEIDPHTGEKVVVPLYRRAQTSVSLTVAPSLNRN
jgi:hypothetical protein